MEQNLKNEINIIKSPHKGIFQLNPNLSIGSKVIESQVLCFVKIDKKLLPIVSEYDGKIRDIFFDDGASIEVNNILMEIKVGTEEPQTPEFSDLEPVIENTEQTKGTFEIKDYILKEGRKFVDFVAIVDILISIITFIAGIVMGLSESSWTIFWSCAGIAFLYYQITLIKNYAIYLFIDMRDSLNEVTKIKAEKDI